METLAREVACYQKINRFKIKINKYSNLRDYAEGAAEAIESFLLEALDHKKTVRVAMSGGQSPLAVYQKLSENPRFPWSRVSLFLVDERYVPLNSKESNYKTVNDLLVTKVKNLRRFYHFNTRYPIGLITDQYQKMLEQLEGEPLFDLVLLGMGADGHTASLFPDDPALQDTHRLVTHTIKPDGSGQGRVTLTFSAILNSEKIFFLIRGADKEKTLDSLLSGKSTTLSLPANEVLRHEDVTFFYCNN